MSVEPALKNLRAIQVFAENNLEDLKRIRWWQFWKIPHKRIILENQTRMINDIEVIVSELTKLKEG